MKKHRLASSNVDECVIVEQPKWWRSWVTVKCGYVC